MTSALVAHAIAIMLATLRLGPMLTFAPPFSLVRMPGPARVIVAVGLAAAMPVSQPEQFLLMTRAGAAMAGVNELAMGLMLALSLQLAFAAIGVAGRALDIQIGYGLASIIDPATKAQMPLIESVMMYGAAAVFFTTQAPNDVYALLALSFERFPIGAAVTLPTPAFYTGFFATVSIMAVGLVGAALMVLFLIDLAIALMSRTLPQMNVLLLGFQVKALVGLMIMPMVIGLSGAGVMRILRLAIEHGLPGN